MGRALKGRQPGGGKNPLPLGAAMARPRWAVVAIGAGVCWCGMTPACLRNSRGAADRLVFFFSEDNEGGVYLSWAEGL